MSDQDLTRLCREAFGKFCSDFSTSVDSLGFRRTTKRNIWVREHPMSADVVHLHRGGVSYGAPTSASVSLRIHLAIRVWNDTTEALALNGPDSSEVVGVRPNGYHLSFNARSFSQYDRCLHDTLRYVSARGGPWFELFATPQALLERDDSPLSPDVRGRLKLALASGADAAAVRVSRRSLGLRK